MRLAREVLLAAVATSVALAMTATSAFAQSIEVVDETNGGHCGDVSLGAGHTVSGGCLVHITSEDNVLTFNHTGTSEAQTSSCENDLMAHLGEDGVGYFAVSDASIGGPNPPCHVTPCDEDALGPHPEIEWPISGLFEFGGDREGMLFTFCVRPAPVAHESEGNTFCTVVLDVTQTGHQQELTAAEEPCFENSAHELSGHWITEATPEGDEVEVELDHFVAP